MCQTNLYFPVRVFFMPAIKHVEFYYINTWHSFITYTGKKII